MKDCQWPSDSVAENWGTFHYKVSAEMVDKEAEAGESLIRDVRVQFTPERTVTAVDKSRVTRRALIPDNLTWKLYDKPSRGKKTTDEGTTTPSGSGTNSGPGSGSTGGNGGGDGFEEG